MNTEQLTEIVNATANSLGCQPSEITVVHVMETPKTCNHEWDNDGCNPEFCLKCGMSFMRYAFCEMP